MLRGERRCGWNALRHGRRGVPAAAARGRPGERRRSPCPAGGPRILLCTRGSALVRDSLDGGGAAVRSSAAQALWLAADGSRGHRRSAGARHGQLFLRRRRPGRLSRSRAPRAVVRLRVAVLSRAETASGYGTQGGQGNGGGERRVGERRNEGDHRGAAGERRHRSGEVRRLPGHGVVVDARRGGALGGRHQQPGLAAARRQARPARGDGRAPVRLRPRPVLLLLRRRAAAVQPRFGVRAVRGHPQAREPRAAHLAAGRGDHPGGGDRAGGLLLPHGDRGVTSAQGHR